MLVNLRKNYSEQEIQQIYALGRFLLDKGDYSKAEIVFKGIVTVAPEDVLSLIALSYLQSLAGNNDEAIAFVKQALRINPDSIVAMLFLVTYLLNIADYQSAGTYLGEVVERIEAGQIEHPYLIRYFKIQFSRFQLRV